MADFAPPMAETRRPAVVVLTTRAQNIDLNPVLWGLEEESIPVDVQEVSGGAAIAIAKEAAHMSPLNVGIGVDGIREEIALHHRDLPADQPLFIFPLRQVGSRELRRLGINAARLVKSEPLVLKDEPLPEPAMRRARRVSSEASSQASSAATSNVSSEPSSDLVERIVQRVLAELVKA
jgi:hypothetical protein